MYMERLFQGMQDLLNQRMAYDYLIESIKQFQIKLNYQKT